MSKTDKDTPFRVRYERGEVGHSGNWGAGDTGFRRSRRALKRIGHKNVRNGKTKFYDVNTVRTAIFYY